MHLAVNNPQVINQRDGRIGHLPSPIRSDKPSQLVEWRDGTKEYCSNHRLSMRNKQTLMVDATR